MAQGDVAGLLASYAYAGSLLVLAELLRRYAGVSANTTRKLVHIGAGMWVFGVLTLFDTWYIGIIPFATFILFNYILYRYRLIRAIDAPDATPGTVYFAVAISLLFLIFWSRGIPVVAAAGSMALTWGDAAAAIFGRAFGRHRYTFSGERKSLEGSVAMFACAAIAMLITILLMAPQLPFGHVLSASTAAAGIATVAEAVSPRGLDNLSVPLAAAATIWILLFLV